MNAIYDSRYHGNVKDDVKECFISFPVCLWVGRAKRGQSVACVFLQTPEVCQFLSVAAIKFMVRRFLVALQFMTMTESHKYHHRCFFFVITADIILIETGN